LSIRARHWKFSCCRHWNSAKYFFDIFLSSNWIQLCCFNIIIYIYSFRLYFIIKWKKLTIFIQAKLWKAFPISLLKSELETLCTYSYNAMIINSSLLLLITFNLLKIFKFSFWVKPQGDCCSSYGYDNCLWTGRPAFDDGYHTQDWWLCRSHEQNAWFNY